MSRFIWRVVISRGLFVSGAADALVSNTPGQLQFLRSSPKPVSGEEDGSVVKRYARCRPGGKGIFSIETTCATVTGRTVSAANTVCAPVPIEPGCAGWLCRGDEVDGGTDSQPLTEGAHHDSGQFGILATIDHPIDVATGMGDLLGFRGDRRLVRAIGGYLGGRYMTPMTTPSTGMSIMDRMIPLI
jgi:hypothetical protein